MQEYGLVLEGGGMRGTFTSGVLDYFMDNNIWVPYLIGVSAGAGNGVSYAARQRGRAKTVNIDMYEKHHYIGLKHLWKSGNFIDFDLLYHRFPTELVPLDFETFFEYPGRFEVVTTNCITAQPHYYEEKSDRERLMDICQASACLPFICKPVEIDNVPMLDGGICDPIPIRRAMSQGYEKNIIVLTRLKEYRKEEKEPRIPGFIYRKYPALRRQLKTRAKQYNETLRFIDELEAQGKAIVIRPLEDLHVDRLEKDVNKLLALYNHGYECARLMMRQYVL